MIIEKITDLITKQFPTYRPWAEAQALYCLAAVNPNAVLPGGGKGLPLTFNPWAIGPSRVAFKSTPIRYVTKELLKMIEYPILPPRFTSEKCIGYIAEQKLDHAALIRDETTGLLAETRKQYLADELSFLCELLDGDISGRMTYAHGVSHGGEIRVNFMTACTPSVFSIIDETFWTQGLGNRLIPIYWMPTVMEEPTKPYGEEGDEWWYEKQTKEIAKILKKQYKTNVRKVRYDDYVRKAVDGEEFIRRKNAYQQYFEDKMSILPSMFYEFNVHTRKVAALHAIDRQLFVENPIVTKEDWKWAKKWIAQRWKEFEMMYTDWKEWQVKEISRRQTTDEGKILSYLQRHGERKRSEISKGTGVFGERLTRALNNLLAEGVISKRIGQSKTRPAILFRIKREEI